MKVSVIFSGGILLLSTLSAEAMIVFDPTVAAKVGYETQQIVNQINVLQSQLNVATQQLNNLKQLSPGQYQWSNAQDIINTIGSSVSQANGLAYNAQNLDSQFRSTYPGFQSPQNYNDQYKNITDSTLNTLNGALQAAGTSAQDFQNESSRLAFLQQQSQSAVGQTQAIQAATQIASEQVSQLQLLRQAVLSQTNAETAYYAAKTQEEASARAELGKVIKAGSTTVPEYGTSGEALTIPHF